MIQDTLAEAIAAHLVTGNVVTLAAGCVDYTPLKKGFDITAKKVFRKVDIDCPPTGRLFSVLPNSSEKSIVFFEDLGATSKSFSKRLTKWTGKLRMTVWINTDKIDPENATGIKRSILEQLEADTLYNLDDIYHLKIAVTAINARDEKPYEKCLLDERVKQYITHPFDYVVMEISTEQILLKGCLPTLEHNPTVC